jgi:hypothetical protein
MDPTAARGSKREAPPDADVVIEDAKTSGTKRKYEEEKEDLGLTTKASGEKTESEDDARTDDDDQEEEDADEKMNSKIPDAKVDTPVAAAAAGAERKRARSLRKVDKRAIPKNRQENAVVKSTLHGALRDELSEDHKTKFVGFVDQYAISCTFAKRVFAIFGNAFHAFVLEKFFAQHIDGKDNFVVTPLDTLLPTQGWWDFLIRLFTSTASAKDKKKHAFQQPMREFFVDHFSKRPVCKDLVHSAKGKPMTRIQATFHGMSKASEPIAREFATSATNQLRFAIFAKQKQFFKFFVRNFHVDRHPWITKQEKSKNDDQLDDDDDDDADDDADEDEEKQLDEKDFIVCKADHYCTLVKWAWSDDQLAKLPPLVKLHRRLFNPNNEWVTANLLEKNLTWSMLYQYYIMRQFDAMQEAVRTGATYMGYPLKDAVRRKRRKTFPKASQPQQQKVPLWMELNKMPPEVKFTPQQLAKRQEAQAKKQDKKQAGPSPLQTMGTLLPMPDYTVGYVPIQTNVLHCIFSKLGWLTVKERTPDGVIFTDGPPITSGAVETKDAKGVEIYTVGRMVDKKTFGNDEKIHWNRIIDIQKLRQPTNSAAAIAAGERCMFFDCSMQTDGVGVSLKMVARMSDQQLEISNARDSYNKSQVAARRAKKPKTDEEKKRDREFDTTDPIKINAGGNPFRRFEMARLSKGEFSESEVRMSLDDFKNDCWLTIPVDPGGRDLITAYHPITGKYFTYSKKQHYELCGYNWQREKQERWKAEASPTVKAAQDVIACNSLKTWGFATLLERWDAVYSHIWTMIQFYAHRLHRKLRFQVHQKKQGAHAHVQNAMTSFILGDKFWYQVRAARRNRWREMGGVGGSKPKCQRQRLIHWLQTAAGGWHRETLDEAASRIFGRPLRVVLLYGNGKFNTSLPGNPSGPLQLLARVLARILLLLKVDEYRTSKLCHRCHEQMYHPAVRVFFDGEGKEVLGPRHDLYRCDSIECRKRGLQRFVHRDRNACLNINERFYSNQGLVEPHPHTIRKSELPKTVKCEWELKPSDRWRSRVCKRA